MFHMFDDVTNDVIWGEVGQTFLAENETYPREYVCQIWLRSDGRVEKKGGGRQTDKGKLQLYKNYGR